MVLEAGQDCVTQVSYWYRLDLHKCFQTRLTPIQTAWLFYARCKSRLCNAQKLPALASSQTAKRVPGTAGGWQSSALPWDTLTCARAKLKPGLAASRVAPSPSTRRFRVYFSSSSWKRDPAPVVSALLRAQRGCRHSPPHAPPAPSPPASPSCRPAGAARGSRWPPAAPPAPVWRCPRRGRGRRGPAATPRGGRRPRRRPAAPPCLRRRTWGRGGLRPPHLFRGSGARRGRACQRRRAAACPPLSGAASPRRPALPSGPPLSAMFPSPPPRPWPSFPCAAGSPSPPCPDQRLLREFRI